MFITKKNMSLVEQLNLANASVSMTKMPDGAPVDGVMVTEAQVGILSDGVFYTSMSVGIRSSLESLAAQAPDPADWGDLKVTCSETVTRTGNTYKFLIFS